MRRKLLEDIYDRMTDEEKRTFMMMTMQDASAEEIKTALTRQQAQLNRIEKNQNWKVDFLSDIGANFLTDGLIYLGRKLLGKM